MSHHAVQLFTIACSLVTIVAGIFTMIQFKKMHLSYHRMYLNYARMYRSYRKPEAAAEMELEAAKALRLAWPFRPQREEASR